MKKKYYYPIFDMVDRTTNPEGAALWKAWSISEQEKCEFVALYAALTYDDSFVILKNIAKENVQIPLKIFDKYFKIWKPGEFKN